MDFDCGNGVFICRPTCVHLSCEFKLTLVSPTLDKEARKAPELFIILGLLCLVMKSRQLIFKKY